MIGPAWVDGTGSEAPAFREKGLGDMPAYYDEEEDFSVAGRGVDRGRSALGRLSTLAGAAVGLALIAGGGFWAFSVGTRDAEEIPLIRAAETAVKERPADPGGVSARHQEITAFEVAESAPAAPVVAALAPQPPSPAEEDLPMGQLAGAAPQVGPVVAGISPAADPLPAPAAPLPAPGAEGLAPEAGSGPVGAQVAAITRIEEPLPPEPDEFELPPRAESLIQSEVELLSTRRPARIIPNLAEPVPPRGEGSEQAPAVAPVFATRPRDLDVRIAAAGAQAQSAVLELARRAEQSKIQIQLGAYPERATIEEEWRRLSRANSDVLSGRALAVQQTTSGGVTYYRLRVGPFRDGHEANTVCQALKARGHDCLVAINTESRG